MAPAPDTPSTATATAPAATPDAATALVPVKEVDYLDQDPPIRGQKYVCLSFVSPEDVLKRKDVFALGRFLKALAVDVSQLLDSLDAKFKDAPAYAADVAEMTALLRQRHAYLWSDDDLHGEYEFFRTTNAPRLDDDFQAANGFHTSVRGIKVRGAYETLPEAQNRVRAIQKYDRHSNVFVAEVGCWCPWSPNPDDVADAEYAETHLNTLMKRYKENRDKSEELYETRKREMMKRVAATNAERIASASADVAAGPSGVEAGGDDAAAASADPAEPVTAAPAADAGAEAEAVTNVANVADDAQAETDAVTAADPDGGADDAPIKKPDWTALDDDLTSSYVV